MPVDLPRYVQTQRTAGYSDASIKTVLLNQGYSLQEIAAAMHPVTKTPTPSSEHDVRRISIVISASLVALLIVFILLTFIMFSPATISEEDLSLGTTVSLAKAEEAAFTIAQDTHTITPSSITQEEVTLVLKSTPQTIVLSLGDEARVDLDDDAIYDVLVRLLTINDEQVELLLKRSHDPVCTEEWLCAPWNDCQESGTQTRSCSDTNNCGTTDAQPLMQQPCAYVPPCEEVWECGAWSSCSSIGFQSRTCTDAHACGTTKNKPLVSQQCASNPPTTSTPSQATCTEAWSCTGWSVCTGSGQQVRVCTDNNACGTEDDKPLVSRSCEEQCDPLWYCTDWESCVDGTQTRTCVDNHACDRDESMPITTRDCDDTVIQCGGAVLSVDTTDTDAYDCFIDASVTCSPAEMRLELTMNLFGLEQTTTTDMFLLSAPGSACRYQEVLLANHVRFSDALRDELLADDMTEEEIDAQEREVQANAEELVGMTETCAFLQGDLTAVLRQWRDGEFSTSDYDNANCTTVLP